MSSLDEPTDRAERQERSARFLAPLLALVAIGLLSSDIISLPPNVARCAGAVWLVGLTIAWTPRWRFGRSAPWGLALAIIGGAGVIGSPWETVRFACLALWICGMRLGSTTEDARRSLGGPICAAVALCGFHVVPVARLVAANLSATVSSLLLAPFGGGSFSGASGGLVALVVLCVCWIGTPRRAAPRGVSALAIGWLALLFGGQLIVERQLVSPDGRIACQAVSFLLGAVVVAWHAARPSRKGVPAKRLLGGQAVAAILAAACLLLPLALAVVDGLRGAHDDPKRVAFLNVDMLADDRTTSDKPLGQAFTGASFGALPLYLEAYGHRCSEAVEISPGLRERADVAIAINPGRAFSPAEREILLDFVRRGGGLLALADHTDIGGIMESFNELLAPTGLRVGFDSAVSARHEWRNALVLPYPESAVFDGADVPVSIGASVSVGPWATVRPLLIGANAFSDPGDRSNAEGRLGNLEFDRGEAYGDVLLAVERDFGRGRIALYGDTSVFQNIALASSSGYVDWLIRHLGGGAGPSPALSLAALLLGVSLLVACARRLGAPMALLGIVLALAAAAGAAELLLVRAAQMLPPSEGRIGVIDAAHANLFDRQALSPEGIDALIVTLSRSGVLPIVWDASLTSLETARRLGEGDVWIGVAATKRYSSKEIDALREAARRGATIVIGTRWPYSTAAEPLLARWGLSVTNVPLGTVRPTIDGMAEAPEFGAAWALETDATWTALGRAVLGDRAFIVAAERRFGGGGVAVVSDVDIFLTEALEGRGYAYVENVRFLERLLGGGEIP